MSKIQDALDKIKANNQNVNKSIVNHDRDNFLRNNYNKNSSTPGTGSSISEMHQVEEFTDEQKANSRIITSKMNDRKVFNAFRELRTTVMEQTNKTSPVIMVTACNSDSGSSFVALNLAASIAMDETKTSLLIDCNFSDPSYSDLTDSENKIGLKEYLHDTECLVEDIIFPTGIPRMRLIKSGDASMPMAEFFTSVRLHNLFDDIRKRYDRRYIIVDAPAIDENADARILAQVCDYVIVVVPYGKNSEKQILMTAKTIGKEKLLGTVLNNEPQMPWLR